MKLRYSVFLGVLIIILGCKPSFDEPQIALDNYKIEDGFDLEMVASEPLLVAPVAMDFDSKGRIWVAEMTGFMSDIDGEGEEAPTGSIKILEDRDHDGVMDHVKVFKDSLVLPRALALVYGGILYAEPPNLWFAEIKDDKPVNPILVDSLYAAEGNPEHQPNGLLLNIDNWIYNAKSHYRYQRKDGKWLKEPTTFRGQWGISHDNFGRLYYNDNSRQLLGDHVLPNRLTRNKYAAPKYGVNQVLTKDQRVYPLHAAYVNRGYAKGVLDKDSLLVNVTAACGPTIYRGGLFPKGYEENAFVCVPEANLVKRNILEFYGDSIAARQAWEGKEFLASTDEGFRPVNLNTGPDGSLYVVDMHRGVIGHHAYLSPYLKKRIKERQLDTLINSGRILKVKHQEAESYIVPNLETMTGEQLVALLKHKNGWVRDRAQHFLVFKQLKTSVPELKVLAQNNSDPIVQIHALYTLKGLEALTFDLLVEVAEKGTPDVISHSLILLEDYVSEDYVNKVKLLFNKLRAKNDKSIDLYLGSSIGVWAAVSKQAFYPVVLDLIRKYESNNRMIEAILSGMGGVSEQLMENMEQDQDLLKSNFYSQIVKVTQSKKENKTNWIFSQNSLSEDPRTKGAKLFRQICSACHGMKGEGIEGLAPPLMKSEYVAKPIERLGLIILNGLEGPVHVNGTLYDLGQVMPGLRNNENITDSDMSSIISYVSNAFSDKPQSLSAEKIKDLRSIKPKSGNEFTEEELLQYVIEN
ncbi:PVC-type heme-binding CxxCH protein [Snuella sedimenti]|uniref:C-type cytochrome n=1 Tax=Snuella sedimenti TaxID=2798802 RepID=A0A8J7LN53_9FLAO|nr:PVC-type heme-binding CxxCH protein [Snuella sedimenti]MBJ6368379.1 c-type cytochrome [Snuella sedimenti]